MHVYTRQRTKEKTSSCSPHSCCSLYIFQCFLKHLFTFAFWISLRFLRRCVQIQFWCKEGALPWDQHTPFCQAGGWAVCFSMYTCGSPALLVLMKQAPCWRCWRTLSGWCLVVPHSITCTQAILGLSPKQAGMLLPGAHHISLHGKPPWTFQLHLKQAWQCCSSSALKWEHGCS